jgi:hypothetical protein
MKKEKLIAEIKKIIAKYGSFSTYDVEAISSPCVEEIGDDGYKLAESFNAESVDVVTYIDDEERNAEITPYEDLTVEVLKEILLMAKKWKNISE